MKNKKVFFGCVVAILIVLAVSSLLYFKNNKMLNNDKPSNSTTDSIGINIDTDSGDEKID